MLRSTRSSTTFIILMCCLWCSTEGILIGFNNTKKFVATKIDFGPENRTVKADRDSFQDKYSFYLLGFDPLNRPTWLSKWGRFDMEGIVAGGPARKSVFENYVKQLVKLIRKSTTLKSTKVGHANQIILVIDYKDFLIYPNPSIEKLSFILQVLRANRKDIEELAARVYVINTNIASEGLASLVAQTVFDRGFKNRVEIFNTVNVPKWLQDLSNLTEK